MDNAVDNFLDEKIEYLYQLRHGCNLFDFEFIAKRLKTNVKRVKKLYYSEIHGSEDISFIRNNDESFTNTFLELVKEAVETQDNIGRALEKNEKLIIDLQKNRETFAMIGTNKAKRRLNKLAKENKLAATTRKAIEIEDKNIQAKNYYGKYRDKIYKVKHKLIHELKAMFDENGWIYGIQKSDNRLVDSIIYFEIPNCEQISWHFTKEKDKKYPIYKKEWDGKENSTLSKLEKVTIELLKENNLL